MCTFIFFPSTSIGGCSHWLGFPLVINYRGLSPHPDIHLRVALHYSRDGSSNDRATTTIATTTTDYNNNRSQRSSGATADDPHHRMPTCGGGTRPAICDRMWSSREPWNVTSTSSGTTAVTPGLTTLAWGLCKLNAEPGLPGPRVKLPSRFARNLRPHAKRHNRSVTSSTEMTRTAVAGFRGSFPSTSLIETIP